MGRSEPGNLELPAKTRLQPHAHPSPDHYLPGGIGEGHAMEARKLPIAEPHDPEPDLWVVAEDLRLGQRLEHLGTASSGTTETALAPHGTTLDSGISRMSVAPLSLSDGMSRLMTARGTTASTAKPDPAHS